MANESVPVLVDTSVWIDAFRGRTSEIVQRTRALIKEDHALTCGPVIFEIKRGLRAAERNGILALFDALVRLEVDETIWESAGDLGASLRKHGYTIPPMDLIIAQVARHHNVPLMTLDEHFRAIPGLKLTDL